MPFTVLYNAPGNLPEMEPVEVASASGAVRALCDELERYGMEHESDQVAAECFESITELEKNMSDWTDTLRSSGRIFVKIDNLVFEASRA